MLLCPFQVAIALVVVDRGQFLGMERFHTLKEAECLETANIGLEDVFALLHAEVVLLDQLRRHVVPLEEHQIREVVNKSFLVIAQLSSTRLLSLLALVLIEHSLSHRHSN